MRLCAGSLSISICSGSGQTASPFTQKAFSITGNLEGLVDPEYSNSTLIRNTKLGLLSGTFIPFSQTSKIQRFKNGVLDYSVRYVLSLAAEHQATSFGVFLELLAEFSKQVDLAEAQNSAKAAETEKSSSKQSPPEVKHVLFPAFATGIDSSFVLRHAPPISGCSHISRSFTHDK